MREEKGEEKRAKPIYTIQLCKCGCKVEVDPTPSKAGGSVRKFSSPTCRVNFFYHSKSSEDKLLYNRRSRARRASKLFALDAVELYQTEQAWKKADSNDPPYFAVNSYRSSSPYQCSGANSRENSSPTGESRETVT